MLTITARSELACHSCQESDGKSLKNEHLVPHANINRFSRKIWVSTSSSRTCMEQVRENDLDEVMARYQQHIELKGAMRLHRMVASRYEYR